MDYKYRFTIVMPVYNVEEFIDEAIQSVINQDIGLEYIQLLLIDDGSTDESGQICDKYSAMYPDNVFTIHKENGGLSSARNTGLDKTEGKYVTFTDPDDVLQSNCLSEVWEFFEAHYDETDITAIKLMYFDGKKGNHFLNYKFSKANRVNDLKENWDCPHMSVASAFIKTEAIGDLRFDERLSFAEDGLFSQSIIMEKQTVGLVSSTQYNYRIRLTGSDSLIQGSANNPKWYLPTLKYYHMALIEKAMRRFGNIPKYLQMVLMYELQWRFKRAQLSTGVLSEDEEQEYYRLICDIAKNIDDDVIDAQRYIWRDIKLFVMSLKYDRQAPNLIESDDEIKIQYPSGVGYPLCNNKVNFDFVKVKDDNLVVEGYTLFPICNKEIKLEVLVNGEAVKYEKPKRNIFDVSLTNKLQENCAFKAVVPLDKKQKEYKIQIAAVVDNNRVILRKHNFGNYVGFDLQNTKSYTYKNGWKLNYDNKNAVVVTKCGKIRHLAAELKFLFSLAKSKRHRKTPLFRCYYYICKLFKRKPIWIIVDRPTQGGDNGEALYRYLLENRKDIDAYFVICSGNPEYDRLLPTGKLLERDSYRHKIKLLLADCVISSHAENQIFNPFGKKMGVAYKDILCSIKRVFLQHGITKDDVSDWLNRYSKNFDGFICAAKPEYESLFDEKYHYNKENIWLTGFPRFDLLEDKAEKRLVIMPTWRKYLCGKWDKTTDTWKLLPNFCQTEFFKFYNGLINNERLIKVAKEKGYIIDFFPHPNLQPHIDLFEKNDDVNFIPKGASYTEIYNRSSLAVTDYSSAIFDFAYLRKPIVYAHFDADSFFAGSHVYTKGYFDYERDGFGEVEYNLDSTVERLIEYMENDCKLKDEYRKRIDDFFAYHDKNSCERVCKKITEIK